MKQDSTRRGFLVAAAIGGGGVLIGNNALAADEKKKEEDVSPPEDLMREHGVLKRVMLIYDEIVRRIEARQDYPPDTLAESAKIIRGFVEDYHEKLEENFLFPRFEKANKLVELVRVLKVQHDAGRAVTEIVLRHADGKPLKDADDQAKVILAIRQFNRMYAPHEAREDTVLFPAFRQIVSANEFDSLGEEFEKKEDQLFGDDGFEKMVDRVAGIEKKLGIYDLAQFTPKV